MKIRQSAPVDNGTIQIRRGGVSYPSSLVQRPEPDVTRFEPVTHVKDGQPLTALGARLLGVRWNGV